MPSNASWKALKVTVNLSRPKLPADVADEVVRNMLAFHAEKDAKRDEIAARCAGRRRIPGRPNQSTHCCPVGLLVVPMGVIVVPSVELLVKRLFENELTLPETAVALYETSLSEIRTVPLL